MTPVYAIETFVAVIFEFTSSCHGLLSYVNKYVVTDM